MGTEVYLELVSGVVVGQVGGLEVDVGKEIGLSICEGDLKGWDSFPATVARVLFLFFFAEAHFFCC